MGRRAGLIALLIAFAAPAAAAPATVVEVAPGNWVRHGVDDDASAQNQDGIANIGFVIGERAVAVIDPGGSLTDGESLRATIQAKTKLPIKYVIMTHGHPDHIFGGSAFAADHAIYVGHQRLPGMMAERGDYYRKNLAEIVGKEHAGDFVVPTLLVSGDTELDLGSRTLEVTAHQTAHTDTDIMVLDRRTGTLWTGDLLFVGRVPSLDGSLTGWLNEIEQLKQLKAVRAVPGHGPVSVPWPAALDDEERYLTALADGTRAALEKGVDIEQAVTTVAQDERSKWALFDAYNGRNVTEAFRELEWE